MHFRQWKRREVVALLGSAAAWPLATRAQQPDRVRRIGVLLGLAEDDPASKARLAAFRQGLDRFGWSDGGNIRVDSRFAPAGAQTQALAKELFALQPEVILAQTTPVVAALQSETRRIPIVFVGIADAVGAGLVNNLARPDGNTTGFMLFEPGITGKWLAMLKEIEPRLVRAALVINPKTAPYYEMYLRAAQAAASSLAIELELGAIGNTAADIERVIGKFARTPNGGVLLPPDSSTVVHRDLVIELAARHKLPAVYHDRVFVEAGGLMCCRAISAGGVLCRPHPARRQACRASGGAAEKVRACDQSENRTRNRLARSAVRTVARRSSHRMTMAAQEGAET